ncbi:MAG: purine-nucleoside phosphorylase [Planctomycetia bacterium]|nr:purine-nucleoside phosphorylase [Planctomycetia bacterium]
MTVREHAVAREGRRPRAGAVEAAARIRAAGGFDAPLGVVLGTGLGGIADRLEDAWAIASRDTGWLASSTATGHRGRLVCGRLGGRPVVMLQGRVHAYEGFPPEMLTRGVELLAALGVRTLLLTNASGGLRPDMQGGELLVMNDHLDFVARPWGEGLEPMVGTVAPAAGLWYDPALVERALAATRAAGLPARQGVYAYLLGPSYETRAEYRMLRVMGADAVGMSTVPEVVVGRLLGLDVAAVSVVTNVARPDAPELTDADEVIRLAADSAEGVWAIVNALLERAVPG